MGHNNLFQHVDFKPRVAAWMIYQEEAYIIFIIIYKLHENIW